MAKKSLIARNKKRANISFKSKIIRKELRKVKRNVLTDPKERMAAIEKMQYMSRDSNEIRHRKRCYITGRPRGNFLGNKLEGGISRQCLRELIAKGLLPGISSGTST